MSAFQNVSLRFSLYRRPCDRRTYRAYLLALERRSVTKQISYLPPPSDKRASLHRIWLLYFFSSLSEQTHATVHAVSLRRCDGVTSSVTVIPEHSLFRCVRQR